MQFAYHGLLSITPANLFQDVADRHIQDRAHLDDAVKCGRAAGCPRDRGVQIGDVDDMKSTQLLFRVGIGPSSTWVLPFATRTVVAVEVRCRPLLPLRTSAFVISSIYAL